MKFIADKRGNGLFWKLLTKKTAARGHTSALVFTAEDEGPFWMTREKQVETRHDRVIEGQFITKRYTKAELTKKQQEKNIVIPGNMKNINHLCVQQWKKRKYQR